MEPVILGVSQLCRRGEILFPTRLESNFPPHLPPPSQKEVEIAAVLCVISEVRMVAQEAEACV